MTMRRSSMGLVIAALLAGGAPAFAGDAPLAERLFREGIELMDREQYAAACEKLAASMEADPSGGTALNFGRCNELQGKTASAWAAYERAVTLFKATGEGERARFAREQAERLKPELSSLTVRAPGGVPGLEVTRDGTALPAAALGSAVPVDPGEHLIEATAPGYEPWSGTVKVEAGGDAQVIEVPPLRRLPEPVVSQELIGPTAEPVPNALVISGATLLGVGGVAAIAGGILGGVVLRDASRAEELCGGTACDFSPNGREGKQLADDAKGKALGANILIGAGAGVAVAGAVLLGLGLSGDAAEPARIVPVAGPRAGGLQLVGRF